VALPVFQPATVEHEAAAKSRSSAAGSGMVLTMLEIC
jgi:hypothetical protein